MTVNPTRRALLTAGGLSLASIALAGCTGGSAGGGSGGGGSKSINAFNGGSGQFTNGFNPFLPTATNPGFRGMEGYSPGRPEAINLRMSISAFRTGGQPVS